jgi:hypothetical protein
MAGEPLDRVEGRVVLAERGDDARAPGVRVARPEGALDAEVDRLGAAARQHDLDGVGAERSGDRLAPRFEQLARRLARAVDRRGVADEPQRVGVRREHLIRHGRGRGVIEIDRHTPPIARAVRVYRSVTRTT